MQTLKNFVPLRQYCRQNDWPRLTQWYHWIYSSADIAEKCVKKIGGRYLVDVVTFHNYVANATLCEYQPHKLAKKH